MVIATRKVAQLFVKTLALVGFFGIVCYPIIISPMMDSTEYKEIQKVARKDMDKEKIQPGNMKVWSDPFGRK